MILSHLAFTSYSSMMFRTDDDGKRVATVIKTTGLQSVISEWLDAHCPGWYVKYTDLLEVDLNSIGLPPLPDDIDDIDYVKSLHWTLDVSDDIEILFKLTFPEFVYSLDK